jgi:curli biogenesis system outer membrane secretion channel CsgG
MKRLLLLILIVCQLSGQTNAQRSKNDPLTNLANSVIGSGSQKSNDKKTQKAQAEADESYNKAMQELALKLSSNILSSGKKRVAVFDFKNTRNEVTELGKFLSEEFSTILFDKKLSVVNREQLKTLMKENKMSADGELNTSDFLKLGKLAGIQIVITGTITLFDKQIRLALKGIDVEQGIIVAAAVGTIPRTDAIDELYTSGSGSSEESGQGGGVSIAQNNCKPTKDCKKMSLGGICISNKSIRDIEVHVGGKGGGNLLIHSGKSEGFNEIPIMKDFQKLRYKISGQGRKTEYEAISIEACKVENVTVN